MHLDGSRSSGGAGDSMPSSAPLCSRGRILPPICSGLVIAILFQFIDGGLTVTSLFLKLFVYVSFALLCLFAGSVWFLAKSSPPKINTFDTCKSHSTHLLDLLSKLMVSVTSSLFGFVGSLCCCLFCYQLLYLSAVNFSLYSIPHDLCCTYMSTLRCRCCCMY